MSAQRLALHQILRNGPRIVTTPHPSTTLVDSDEDLKNYPNGPLFEAALPYVQSVRNVPLSIDISPLSPIHLLGFGEQSDHDSTLTLIPKGSPTESIEEKLPLPTVKPNSLCEAGVQTEAAITTFVGNFEAKAWAKKWEMVNLLGEIDFDAKDFAGAHSQFKKAAQNGCVEAMTNLAHCYAEGIGCKKSYTRAFTWWEKAMKGGDLEAQYQVALCYIRGEGTQKSTNHGQKLMGLAANSGHSHAALYMALLLLRHEHFQQDTTFASDVTRLIRLALEDEGCEKKLRHFAACSEVPITAKLVLHEALRHN